MQHLEASKKKDTEEKTSNEDSKLTAVGAGASKRPAKGNSFLDDMLNRANKKKARH